RSYYGSADGRTQERLFRLDTQVSVDVLKGRAPRLVRNLRTEPRFEQGPAGFRSALAAPLRRDGRLVGTLALYDKVAPDPFTAGPFTDDDLQIFSKYVSYVERALESAALHAATRQHRNIDEATGLPSGEYLARRVDQEIARAAGRPGALALVTCRLENLPELRRSGDPARADRLVLRTAEALRARLRDFDVLARSAEDTFAALLPEPGEHPEERVTALARAVADEIAKDERLNEPDRVALAFGYAVHPEEGGTRETLLAKAASPRIRMV
ncbi:MAG: diguanylate cyclase, partial [Myxococcota bacterium]|nr:diguanylate cyclase [Myxococcota bacterium]